MNAVAPAALAFLAGGLASTGLLLLAPPSRRGRRARLGSLLLRLLAAAGRRLRPVGARVPRDLETLIAAAGSPGGLGARELMAAKSAAALVVAAGGAALGGVAPGRLGVVVALAAPVAGFMLPDLQLARVAAARARRARRELPALLDLLRVTVEAGASLPSALGEVGETAGGPLAAEWRAVGREVALGVPLDAALEGMSSRLPLPEVRALVAGLARARRHGAPLAGTLAAQSGQARAALARRAREDAARAGPKIQLVVALMLVPSVLLLVAAALLAALLGPERALLPA